MAPEILAPKTLLQMAGASIVPSKLSDAVLIVIDAQKEYVDGKLPLTGDTVAAAEVHRNALTVLSDRFAVIAPDAKAIAD